MGKTDRLFPRAIVAGERDPVKLAQFRDWRIHASAEQIAKSLRGNSCEEHLFWLAQARKLFDAYQQLIDECDERLEQVLRPPNLEEPLIEGVT